MIVNSGKKNGAQDLQNKQKANYATIASLFRENLNTGRKEEVKTIEPKEATLIQYEDDPQELEDSFCYRTSDREARRNNTLFLSHLKNGERRILELPDYSGVFVYNVEEKRFEAQGIINEIPFTLRLRF